MLLSWGTLTYWRRNLDLQDSLNFLEFQVESRGEIGKQMLTEKKVFGILT